MHRSHPVEVDPRKKLRTEKESGPIRYSDRIRNWYIDGPGSVLLNEAEWEYIEKFELLDRWKDHSVYKDENGEPYPELLTAFFAMDGYARIAENNAKQRSQGAKQSYDF